MSARDTDDDFPPNLQALEAFLLSERAPRTAMTVSGIDGLLTAVAIGPEPLMPSEWLPAIWGEEEPAFADAEEAQRINAHIMAHYNEIVTTIYERPEDFAPAIWATPEGGGIPGDWAAGFLDAVRLNPQAWAPLFDDEEASALMTPLMFAGATEDVAAELGITPERESEMLNEIADILPSCVLGIHTFWLEREIDDLGSLDLDDPPAAPRRSAKVGRNKPCPCGSGKKYKRCCGA